MAGFNDFANFGGTQMFAPRAGVVPQISTMRESDEKRWVKTPQEITDRDLRHQVLMLLQNANEPMHELAVDVEDGVVTLRGSFVREPLNQSTRDSVANLEGVRSLRDLSTEAP